MVGERRFLGLLTSAAYTESVRRVPVVDRKVEAVLERAGFVESDGKLFYLVKVDGAKFSKMVVPGDKLELEVILKRTIRNMALYQGIARVDGEQVACADILCAEVVNEA